MENIEWIFFDVGSTLVDESKAFEERLKTVAEAAKVSYEYVYQTALEFYQENKKGDLETMKLLNVEKPKWPREEEILYCETEACLRKLSIKSKKQKRNIVSEVVAFRPLCIVYYYRYMRVLLRFL